MLISKLLGERYKERPSDATLISHVFLLRGGYIRQVSNGIFSLLPLGLNIARKIENVIRLEMNAIGAEEVLLPVALPAELWKESGRYDSVGEELLRFSDRTGRQMLLGMTHEEAAVHLARSEIKAHTQLPLYIYQIQTKYRDEPRPRGGLVRVREFVMKDGYSFHASQEDLERCYSETMAAYERIFKACGLKNMLVVSSDTGMMGGKTAHEFMLLSEGGEDSLVLCERCSYRSNMDVAESQLLPGEPSGMSRAEVHTPGITDIAALAAFLKISEKDVAKAAVFKRADTSAPVVVFLRGDLEVNETKLQRAAGCTILPAVPEDNLPLCLGYVGVLGIQEGEAEVYYDRSLEGMKGFVTGANKVDYHMTGVDIEECSVHRFLDLAKVREGDLCPVCSSPLTIKRGIEVGNIFQLGDRYTKAMGMTYTDEHNEQRIPLMGCYGIGVGRLLACVIEDNHDEYGPVWPRRIAPYDVHICCLSGRDMDIADYADKLYGDMSALYDVIMDDRAASAGVQFADADLIGAPIRVILSRKNMDKGVAEIVFRNSKRSNEIPLGDLKDFLKTLLESETEPV